MIYFISKEFTEILNLFEMADLSFFLNYSCPICKVTIESNKVGGQIFILENQQPNDKDETSFILKGKKDDELITLYKGSDVYEILDHVMYS